MPDWNPTRQLLINGIIGMWPKSSRRKIPHSDKPTFQDLSLHGYTSGPPPQ